MTTEATTKIDNLLLQAQVWRGDLIAESEIIQGLTDEIQTMRAGVLMINELMDNGKDGPARAMLADMAAEFREGGK